MKRRRQGSLKGETWSDKKKARFKKGKKNEREEGGQGRGRQRLKMGRKNDGEEKYEKVFTEYHGGLYLVHER